MRQYIAQLSIPVQCACADGALYKEKMSPFFSSFFFFHFLFLLCSCRVVWCYCFCLFLLLLLLRCLIRLQDLNVFWLLFCTPPVVEVPTMQATWLYDNTSPPFPPTHHWLCARPFAKGRFSCWFLVFFFSWGFLVFFTSSSYGIGLGGDLTHVLSFSFGRGTSGIDIDLRRVDIDQCPPRGGNTQLNIFAASDKCKLRTTKVK